MVRYRQNKHGCSFGSALIQLRHLYNISRLAGYGELMNKKTIGVVAVFIFAALNAAACSQKSPPIPPTSSSTPMHTSTPLTQTTSSGTGTTTPPTTIKTTVLSATTTATSTTSLTASLALYVPDGQQFTGGIWGQGANFVDKAPFCAYGGSPVSGYTWNLANGSTLPPGTTFDPTTGMFYRGGSGVALVAGTHTFKMVVSDGSKTATGTFYLVVNTGDILATAVFQKSLAADITLPDARVGMGYGVSLRASGNGALPWTWSIMSGDLPPGLKINPSSGVIYGTPLSSAAGITYKFRISVKDSIGVDAIGEPTYSIFVPK
jgi:large repetitive protein